MTGTPGTACAAHTLGNARPVTQGGVGNPLTALAGGPSLGCRRPPQQPSGPRTTPRLACRSRCTGIRSRQQHLDALGVAELCSIEVVRARRPAAAPAEQVRREQRGRQDCDNDADCDARLLGHTFAVKLQHRLRLRRQGLVPTAMLGCSVTHMWSCYKAQHGCGRCRVHSCRAVQQSREGTRACLTRRKGAVRSRRTACARRVPAWL